MAEENLKYKTKKGIYWTFFNTFAKNGLGFVVGVIMARLLSPSDYGITALPEIFIALGGIFMESGFSNAMVRKTDLKDEDLSTAFYYSTIVGILCYILIYFSAPYIAAFYDTPVIERLVRITALIFLWSPLTTPQSVILQRKLDFKTLARINITNNIIGAVIGVTMAYCGYGLWALVAMSISSSLINCVQRFYIVRWLPKAGWSRESFRYLWGYGNKLMASAFLDITYGNIVPIIVGKYFSTAQLGYYNRARGYANLPASQGTAIIQSVSFPVLSKMQEDGEMLARNYRKMLKLSAFVIFPIMMLLAALSKPIIITLVTEKWYDSIILLQLICFSSMWYPIHAINLNLLQVKGRSDLFLRLEIYKKVLGLSVMACTLPFGLVYFVAAGIASSFIALFINTYYTGKLIGVGFREQMQDLLPTYGLSILTFCLVLGMNQFIDSLWMQLILGGLVGTIFYIGVAFLCNFSEIEDVKYMLNRQK